MLTHFARSARALGISQIAEEFGLQKSSVHYTLRELVALGMLEQDPGTHLYRLSGASFGFAHELATSLPHRFPVLEKIPMWAEDHGVNVYLSQLAGTKTFVAWATSLRVSTTLQIGLQAPVHVSAAGKALVARMEPELWDSYLPDAGQSPQFTEFTRDDPTWWKEELTAAREAGVAWNRREIEEELGSVAAALGGLHVRMQLAVSLVVPWSEVVAREEASLETLVREVKRMLES